MKKVNPQKLERENIEKIRQEALNDARTVAPKYCEKCGYKYKDDDFRLVKKDPKQTVFHLRCEQCTNTYILNIISPGPNIMASQRSNLNIDLQNVKEMTKYAGKKPVSRNEALDVLNTLKTENLERLLKK